MNRRKLLLFRIAGLLLALTILVGGLEVFFRVRAMQREDEPFFGYYASPVQYDEVAGYALVPGLSNSEFTVSPWGYRVNGTGDDEPRPGGVLCIGGSTTFGSGIPDGGTTSALLEAGLRAKTGTDIRVVNGGVPGMHIHNWVRRIDGEMERLKPRFVVVWLGWNIYGAAITHGDAWRPDILAPAGVTVTPAKHGFLGRILAKSVGYCRVLRELRNLQLRLRGAPEAGGTSYEEKLLSRAWSLARDTSSIAPVFSSQLDTVVSSIVGHGAIPVLMSSPFLAPDPGVETALVALKPSFASETQYWDPWRIWWNEMNGRIRAEAARRHAPIVDMAEICRAWSPEERARYFTDMIHMTPEGNARIVEKLEPVILAAMER